MDFWLIFSGIAYVLVLLSVVIIWRGTSQKHISLISLLKQWPLVDKILLSLWFVQLLIVLVTHTPHNFAINSVLLLYLVSRINKQILSKEK
jgi:hypothetical protein